VPISRMFQRFTLFLLQFVLLAVISILFRFPFFFNLKIFVYVLVLVTKPSLVICIGPRFGSVKDHASPGVYKSRRHGSGCHSCCNCAVGAAPAVSFNNALSSVCSHKPVSDQLYNTVVVRTDAQVLTEDGESELNGVSDNANSR